MMSAYYFTKFLLLLRLAIFLIDHADAKLFGNGGYVVGAVPQLQLPGRGRGVPISPTTLSRKVAVIATVAGTSPQHQHNHYDAITIISKVRGGGSGRSIEENSDYDPTGNDTDIAAEDDEDFTPRNHVDKSYNEDYHDKNNEEDSPSLPSKANNLVKSQNGNVRIRRNKDTKHPKTKSHKSSINKQFMTFAKRHQFHCYILLTIIAFRSDIFELLACRYHLIPTVLDPVTSQRKVKINWSTDVLKLIMVIEVVRRYFLPSGVHDDTTENDGSEVGDDVMDTHQNSTQSLDQTQSSSPHCSKNNRNPPILPLLIFFSVFLLLPRNLFYFILPMCFRILLTTSGGMPPDPDSPLGKMLLLLFGRGDYYSDLAKRMAYLPPLEQHYTFEQLNERYYRDWGAFRKAFDTHPMVSAAGGSLSFNKNHGDRFAPGVGVASLASLVMPNSRKTALLNPTSPYPDNKSTMPNTKTDCYPSEYNNGTVIVLDMTKLDTQASRMESVRDQINFLTHYLAFTEEISSSHNNQRHVREISINGTNATEPDATVLDSTDVDLMSNMTESLSTAVAHEPAFEIIVLLESPGGGVSQYGLAASHLQRLRSNPNVKLTICIDSVAASGGYMMACMSSPGQLYCAPFAMVGSIGVIGQSLNIQKTLEGYGVRPYVFRGGKMKNPVGMLGDVTKEGVVAMQLMVDRIHDAFRDHVASAREEAFAKALQTGVIPKDTGRYFQLGASDDSNDKSNSEFIMDQVATGDVFLGVQAIKFGLVDRLITSDEYISERIRQGARVLKLINYHRPMGLVRFLGAPHMQHHMRISSVVGNDVGLIDVFNSFAQKVALALKIVWIEGVTNHELFVAKV